MLKKKNRIHKYLPFPIKASHREYSMIASSHDDTSPPTKMLMDLSLKAIQKAGSISLQEISHRMKLPPYYPDIWPGEHYKLLAAFVEVLKPKQIIEIGTEIGMSALCMKQTLPKDGVLTTFDITSWDSYDTTLLKIEDFEDKRLVQHTDNLYYFENITKHRDALIDAELIFIDATHDGILEAKLMSYFEKIPFKKSPYLIFDDIRVWTMLKMWRDINHPKMDLTSFGHWSGTGIVQWKGA